MNLMDEFNKMSLTFKHMVISVAVLMPFWLVAIYLLNRSLYDTGDLIIIGAFCFCFSVTWYFIGLFVSLVTARLQRKRVTSADKAAVGGIISVLYLSLVILVSYVFEWSFLTFIGVAYTYGIVSVLVSRVRYEMHKEEAEKRQSQLKSDIIRNLTARADELKAQRAVRRDNL